MFGVFKIKSDGSKLEDYILVSQHMSLNHIKKYGYINKYYMMKNGYYIFNGSGIVIFDSDFHHTNSISKALMREMAIESMLEG